jgi:hypothetical protein
MVPASPGGVLGGWWAPDGVSMVLATISGLFLAKRPCRVEASGTVSLFVFAIGARACVET